MTMSVKPAGCRIDDEVLVTILKFLQVTGQPTGIYLVCTTCRLTFAGKWVEFMEAQRRPEDVLLDDKEWSFSSIGYEFASETLNTGWRLNSPDNSMELELATDIDESFGNLEE
jgi:hypothetical protein